MPGTIGRWLGSCGEREDWDEAGAALARRGVVVFAPDYRATGSNDELTRDLECGYRYVRSIAEAYGGDLTGRHGCGLLPRRQRGPEWPG